MASHPVERRRCPADGIIGAGDEFSDPDAADVVEGMLNRTLVAFLGVGLMIASVLLLGTEAGPTHAPADISVRGPLA